METFSFILKMSVVAIVFVAILIAIPYMLVKFTEPTWATPKTFIEFIIIVSILSGITGQTEGPIGGYESAWIIVIALIISVFRYRSRVARYKKLKAQSNAENI